MSETYEPESAQPQAIPQSPQQLALEAGWPGILGQIEWPENGEIRIVIEAGLVVEIERRECHRETD